MSHYGLKISKTESPDKTPYTVYYPHNIPVTERRWIQPYYQVISIDPARKNYAFRIERRYHNGWITPVVFDKVAVEAFEQTGNVLINNTYQMLTAFLNKYEQYYNDCHFVIIERQLPQNYKATRIAQHSISYFSIKLQDRPLLPSIIEIDPKLKGKVLGAPKGINDKQLKTWAVEKARYLLTMRLDDFSLKVLDHFRNKQDDLSDTVCQIEALFICWGLLATINPPVTGPDNVTLQPIKPLTLQLTPAIVIPGIVESSQPSLPQIAPLIGNLSLQVYNGSLTGIPVAMPVNNPLQVNPTIKSSSARQNKILSLVNNAPMRGEQPRLQACIATKLDSIQTLGQTQQINLNLVPQCKAPILGPITQMGKQPIILSIKRN
ncbi:Hypothetical protein HVR_LOCUS1301 [uncultured virus]|nr:Hypothetical protein HVR_LOCUS1301 [uncultured virus]